MRRVLGQQLALNVARMGFIHLQSNRLTQRVNLHLALGGSFEVLEEEQEAILSEEEQATSTVSNTGAGGVAASAQKREGK